MLRVIANDYLRADAIDAALPLYRELVAETRKEALCIAYDLLIDREDPTHFVFLEEWPDQAALDLHCATEHFTRLVPQINALTRREGDVILMDTPAV